MAQVVNLVLFEAGDEGTLMLLKNELGQESTNSEHRDKLDDVHLLCKLFRCIFVSLVAGHLAFEPG